MSRFNFFDLEISNELSNFTNFANSVIKNSSISEFRSVTSQNKLKNYKSIAFSLSKTLECLSSYKNSQNSVISNLNTLEREYLQIITKLNLIQENFKDFKDLKSKNQIIEKVFSSVFFNTNHNIQDLLEAINNYDLLFELLNQDCIDNS